MDTVLTMGLLKVLTHLIVNQNTVHNSNCEVMIHVHEVEAPHPDAWRTEIGELSESLSQHFISNTILNWNLSQLHNSSITNQQQQQQENENEKEIMMKMKILKWSKTFSHCETHLFWMDHQPMDIFLRVLDLATSQGSPNLSLSIFISSSHTDMEILFQTREVERLQNKIGLFSSSPN
jgi:hypothetical protein